MSPDSYLYQKRPALLHCLVDGGARGLVSPGNRLFSALRNDIDGAVYPLYSAGRRTGLAFDEGR